MNLHNYCEICPFLFGVSCLIKQDQVLTNSWNSQKIIEKNDNFKA